MARGRGQGASIPLMPLCESGSPQPQRMTVASMVSSSIFDSASNFNAPFSLVYVLLRASEGE